MMIKELCKEKLTNIPVVQREQLKSFVISAVRIKSPNATLCGISSWLLVQRVPLNKLVIDILLDELIEEKKVIEVEGHGCDQRKKYYSLASE